MSKTEELSGSFTNNFFRFGQMDGIKQRGLITQKQSLITKMRFWINMSISYHQGLGIMNEKNKQTQVFVAAGCSAVH